MIEIFYFLFKIYMTDNQDLNIKPVEIIDEGNIEMKIEKVKNKEKPTENKGQFLDDHIGLTLAESIAKLLSDNKEKPKKKRAKRTMTDEQKERCRQNLAKGRATILKNKQAKQQIKEPVNESVKDKEVIPEPKETQPESPPSPPESKQKKEVSQAELPPISVVVSNEPEVYYFGEDEPMF